MRDVIIQGVITSLWGLAWHSHVAEHDHHCKCAMPDPPASVREHAERIVKDIERINDESIDNTYKRAVLADGFRLSGVARLFTDKGHALKFGKAIADTVWFGRSFSWFDEHVDFRVLIPYDGRETNRALQICADRHCF